MKKRRGFLRVEGVILFTFGWGVIARNLQGTIDLFNFSYIYLAVLVNIIYFYHTYLEVKYEKEHGADEPSFEEMKLTYNYERKGHLTIANYVIALAITTPIYLANKIYGTFLVSSLVLFLTYVMVLVVILLCFYAYNYLNYLKVLEKHRK